MQRKWVGDLMFVRRRFLYRQGWPMDTVLKSTVVQELWKEPQEISEREPEADAKINQKMREVNKD